MVWLVAIEKALPPILLGANESAIQTGMYGFNPVLTMMAVGWAFLFAAGKSVYWSQPEEQGTT